MGRKTVLFTVIGVLVAVPVASAGESGANKPVTGYSEEQAGAPAGEHKLDFKELFGCEPMGEGGHMPKPASGADPQGQPAQEHERKQDKP